MELKLTNTIGKLGLPITEVHNIERVKIYEAHDDLPCEFWSIELLETMETYIDLLKGDIQEIVALLGKGVNRYGEKMRAMKELLDEKWDELLLFQGRGKPNLDSLQKGKKFLEKGLRNYCEGKGLNFEKESDKKAFEEIFTSALNEEHMTVFKQI